MLRSMLPWGIAFTFVAGAGCAGQSKPLRADNAKLRGEVSVLKAQRRRDRRKVRDLEKRLVLEERARPPALRVDVVGPESERAPVAELAPAEASREADEQVAYADDDVEIVYVGEAAEESSIRPSLKLDETRSRARYRPIPRVSKPSRPGTSVPITRARSGDRLAVVRGKVPALPREGVRPGPRALYKRYYRALRDGLHSAAIEGFRAFVADYPSHDYADNAQYWLGEAYYDQRKYKEALTEFAKVGELFPKGNKVSDAMLKTAFCHERLGDAAKARGLLGHVITRYPKSNAAALAADRLDKLQADK